MSVLYLPITAYMCTKGEHNLQNNREMKIEQIKELKGMISQAVADDRMSQSCAVEIMDKIDAILALPLDVPSDDWIENELWENINIPLSEQDRLINTDAYKQYKETFLWMRWMREEIIKRNK